MRIISGNINVEVIFNEIRRIADTYDKYPRDEWGEWENSLGDVLTKHELGYINYENKVIDRYYLESKTKKQLIEIFLDLLKVKILR